MPARRSRTEHWRESLQQLQERNGAIEISLPGPAGEDALRQPEQSSMAGQNDAAPDGSDSDAADGLTKNLIWRVRVLQLFEDVLIVETPTVMRQRIDLEPGIALVGVISIGPNRWMFETVNLGATTVRLAGGREAHAIRLRMPDKVERCQRRSFYRISTVGLSLPRVECFPLLDAESAVPAETANRALILERQSSPALAGRITAAGEAQSFLLPEVGPSFPATLVNVGGGGVGLLVEPHHSGPVNSSKQLWLRITLTPHIPAPLCVTARVVHTHLDTTHRVYAGVSFDFSMNKPHEQFVVSQICRYVAELQREQLRRQSAVG